MRFLIDIVKPGRIRPVAAPGIRAAAFGGLARTVFPEAPWLLYQALEGFLKPDGSGGYLCRTVQRGCRPCPLASRCPAAKNFLSREV